MKKWRIVRYGHNYCPEHRMLGFWWPCKSAEAEDIFRSSLEEAREYIEIMRKPDKPVEREIIEVD